MNFALRTVIRYKGEGTMNNFITGGESFSFTLNSPITKSQWEEITDVNMEHSDKVTFITPKGKKVEYVKEKHGTWIIRDNPGTGWYRVTCSECGEDVTSEAPVIGFFPNAKVVWEFCPYCGAKMDGEIATNGGEPLSESYKEEADDPEG